MFDFTDVYHEVMAKAIFSELKKQDSVWTRYLPFTAEECKAAAVSRTSEIHAHNNRCFPELEEFAIYFYTEANYDLIAAKCNRMLQAEWQWD